MNTILPPVAEPKSYNENYLYFWNHVGLEMNRLTHSIGGPQTGPTMSSRALGILHLALHDAYFAIHPNGGFSTYLGEKTQVKLPEPPAKADARQAVAGAAIAVLEAFYAQKNVGSNFSRDVGLQLDQTLRAHIAQFSDLQALSDSFRFGSDVGEAMLEFLAIKPGEPGADQGSYRPRDGRYFFRDEPTNPVRPTPLNPDQPDGPTRPARIYHAPFYGITAKRFAVQMKIGGAATTHQIADPPVGFGTSDAAEYDDSVADVIRMGGAAGLNSTLRRPDQTVGGYFWAYDGANLIGTPPRLYNQILRKVAWEQACQAKNETERCAEFIRLFALANAAMADAGIFAWREKYAFEFWRPLSGVREHDKASGPAADADRGNPRLDELADPFWLTLGAPETNTDKIAFKPPFPAYPSGHATFGAAVFEIMRLFYAAKAGQKAPETPDKIGFSIVSEELNGVSRDLRQKYVPTVPITDQAGTVRTRVVRSFPSLWSAIFENAISRIWLGVHWRFDAFAAKDVLVSKTKSGGPPYEVEADGTTKYRPVDTIGYVTTGPRKDAPDQQFPIGGVPLGLGIAQDIFAGGLCPTPAEHQPGYMPPSPTQPEPVQPRQRILPKSTETNIR